MEFPVRPLRAQTVPDLPGGPGWWFEPEFDGQRTLLFRDEGAVRLHTGTGRTVTALWPDLVHAARRLPPGTVVDGVAVIWRDGCLDPGAVHARAGASPGRARELARTLPASYAVFDLLAHPVHGDVRALGYAERRGLLLDVLGEPVPPLQPVPATDDHETALIWYEALRDQGIEGVLAKPEDSPYRPDAADWRCLRHSESAELPVVGYTGAASLPKALAVELPDGRRVLTEPLGAGPAAQAAPFLTAAGAGERARTGDGEAYAGTAPGLVALARTGTARHAAVRVVAVRRAPGSGGPGGGGAA
ncbi:hypothetical protein [Streptomyces sp. NPDC101132]|uniref:ATP-dependent DNA ligase n=1 Tax=Streptomyces sp. NPDC101132 TaxID=3366110 RepID=UPI0037F8A4B3